MSAARVYRIQVRGELGPEWSAWFDAVQVEGLGDGTSALTVHLPDQTALHGLLARGRDLGLEILTVESSEVRKVAT